MNVLIIDDQPKKFKDLRDYLNGRFVDPKIHYAKSFQSARQYLRLYQLDLVLLDMSFDVHNSTLEEVNFVGLAGLHVLQFMKRARIETSVIVCTAHRTYSDPDFGSIDGLEALNKHVTSHFGSFCKGCVYMGADRDEWISSLDGFISDAK